MPSSALFRSALLPALLSLPFAVHAQFAGAKAVPNDLKVGFNAISIDDAKKWLGFLAGPECEGRGTGQPGFQKAADFVAGKFKEFGLKPIGDKGTYFQNVPFYRFRVDPKESFLAVGAGGSKIMSSGKFDVSTGGGDVDVMAPVVFVRAKGKGAIPEGVDLKGKIAVIFYEGGRMSNELRRSMFRSGASATLTVEGKVPEASWSVRRGKLEDFKPSERTPTGTISTEAAKSLMKSLEVEEDFATKELAEDGSTSANGTKDVRLVAKTIKEDVGVPNVVGLLEGSDPKMKDEVVAIGAHLDHLGKQGDTIWYGADDDGSGSTALLCVAKAFSLNPVRPKRSVLFMAFCGEEMGLLGSAYYAANPIIPLDKTQCLMQMDMVGRDSFDAQNGDQNRIDKVDENKDTMRLVGSKRISQEYDDIIQDENKYIGFKFKYDAEDVYTRSDHYNFARNGVPIAFQFCGFTPDYHQPTDTVDKINFLKLTNAAKLCYLTLNRVGNMDGKLKRDGSDEKH